MQEKYYLYKHTFPNNKVYIGITHLIPQLRWKNDGKGYITQRIMWNAIQKYGWKNIKHEILYESNDKDQIEKLERKYITEIYHSNCIEFGYNLANGGNYKGRDNKISIDKRVKKLKGQKRSIEQKANISKAHIGIKCTEEQKKKMSKIMSKKYIGKNNPMYGKKLTNSHKEILFSAILATRKRKRVLCVETGKIFESVTLAGKEIGLSRKDFSNLSCVIGKQNRTCRGYHWEYVDNQEIKSSNR